MSQDLTPILEGFGSEGRLSARIVTLADIYDALRSPRSYKPGLSHDEAREIIIHGDGRTDPERHFDPELLRLFADNHEAMAEIWDGLSD